MKKKAKKLACLLLAALLLCSMFSMTSWAADTTKSYTTSDGNTISVPTRVVVYYDGTGTQMGNFTVSGLTPTQKIVKSSVKSSNKKVASLYLLGQMCVSYEYQAWEENLDGEEVSKTAAILFYVKGTGTSKISYQIAGKTYKTTVKSYAYSNPLKSVKISGVSNRANVASKLKKTSSAAVTLSATQKNPSVAVKAASGWKIKEITVTDVSTSEEIYYSQYGTTKGVSSAALYPGRLTKGRTYQLSIYMENTKTGGDIVCFYTIQ